MIGLVYFLREVTAMEVEFVKIDPTQNMTILVTSDVDAAIRADVASALMAYEGAYAEQVGFVEDVTSSETWARLEMAGGEFCGNATMSLAAYLAWGRKLPDGIEREVPLESSGAGLVSCAVRPDHGEFFCTLRMPEPERIEERSFSLYGKAYQFAAVYLPGITHVLVPRVHTGENPRSFAEAAAAAWAGEIETDAFGVILYDESSCAIEPLVCVKTSGTTVWERGCGSGSAAVGAYRAYLAGCRTHSHVRQPGGVIEVDAEFGAPGSRNVSITGRVRIVARGVFFYDEATTAR